MTKKLEINVKNYKSLVDSTFNIKLNQINYIVGANESGKTQVAKVINFIDNNTDQVFSKEDRTLINGMLSDQSILVTYSLENSINSKLEDGSYQFFIHDSASKKAYIDFINKNKQKFDSIKKNLSSLLENGNIDQTTFSIVNLFLSDILSFKNVNVNEEIKKFEANIYIKINILKENKDFFDEIISKRNDLMIIDPIVKFVEPIITAKKDQDISYPWKDVLKQNSNLRNIILYFLTSEDIKQIELLDKEEDEHIKETSKNRIFEKLNAKIKKYFEENFKHIAAYPKLIPSGGKVLLSIESKKAWKYDSSKENERSEGFKSFCRIVMEISALPINETGDVIYIIDEPEQALHPYLQNELMKKLRDKIKNNINLTIVLISHSPFIVNLQDFNEFNNVIFVSRDKEGKSVTTNLSDKKQQEILENLSNWIADDPDNDEIYLYKIIFNSFLGDKFRQLYSKKIKELRHKISDNKLSFQEREKAKNDLNSVYNFKSELM